MTERIKRRDDVNPERGEHEYGDVEFADPVNNKYPPVSAGWTVEEARLSEDFELDRRGDRAVRLIRELGTTPTESGPVRRREFQVDRG